MSGRSIDSGAGRRPSWSCGTKADAAGSWRAADAAAALWSDELDLAITPVMALLATVDLTAEDYALLRAVADSPLALPESVGRAATALEPVGAAHLLDVLGGYGLACAVGALRETPELAAPDLSARLRGLSGLDALPALLAAAAVGMAQRRAAELDRRMRADAFTDCADRDALEQAILDRAAVSS